VNALLSADDLAPFKKAFIFCARNQLDTILLRIPTKTLNPKLLAMKQARDPQLGNFTDLLQFARQLQDAPARISQLEETIANLPQQRQALEEQRAALDNWMASARGQPLFEGCPYCEGTGRMRTRFDPLNALNTYPRPLVPIEQNDWAPFGFEYVTCPYCGGTGFLSTGLGEQINKAQAQQQDIARQIADFQNYSNKLAQDLANAEQTLESAGHQLEVSRAKLLAAAAGVH
jgi:DNA repair exonuclease SbcCD ATPase subunit